MPANARKMRKERAPPVAPIVIGEANPADHGVRPDDAIVADPGIGVDDGTGRDARARADRDALANGRRCGNRCRGIDVRRRGDAGKRVGRTRGAG